MIRQVDWKRVAEDMIGIHSIEGRRDYFKACVSVDGTERPVVESAKLEEAPKLDKEPTVCTWTRISSLDFIEHFSTRHGAKNELHLWRGRHVCPVCNIVLEFK
jgi:hypothetical protein